MSCLQCVAYFARCLGGKGVLVGLVVGRAEKCLTIDLLLRFRILDIHITEIIDDRLRGFIAL